MHCLQAVFPFKPPQRIEARTHLQLGSVLYHHTKNSEQARSHLEKALTNQQELWAFIVTNLASVYIREGNRHQELYSLLERINPDHSFPVSSHCLRAAAFYVRGLFSFFQGRYNEAKRFLRETLKMSNAVDLNRLTACSLVLLGHIFYVLGNHRESNNMVVPAMQLASKIPDMSVQLWSSALLRDLNKACGNAMDAHEAARRARTSRNSCSRTTSRPAASLSTTSSRSTKTDDKLKGCSGKCKLKPQ